MFEFKLQIGCLLILLYFVVVYIKGASLSKIPCNHVFDMLLVVAPWAVVFDGLTAWTVNHKEMVPYWINLVAHGLFFILMELVLMIWFLYMVKQTIGITRNITYLKLMMPSILAIILTICFLPELQFLDGKTINYSMGISVYVCFISLAIHFLILVCLLVAKRKRIEQRKLFSISSCLLIAVFTIVIQIIYPELLVTSIIPTVAVIGMYVNIEDPSLQRLQLYNEEMVTGFATLVENRDDNTGGHIRRTRDYVQIILEEMKKEPAYVKMISKDYERYVRNAAPMHDIGKIATPDYVLLKPGKLDKEEYEIMKKHAATGGEIIISTFSNINEPEFERISYEVARHHHEKWNGTGYPDGLKGEEIPLHARIMAIADVFDAVSAKRIYRDAMPVEKCFQIIEEGAGSDFDPTLARLFLNAKERVLNYYNKERSNGEL